jgi:hypothetical protein
VADHNTGGTEFLHIHWVHSARGNFKFLFWKFLILFITFDCSWSKL